MKRLTEAGLQTTIIDIAHAYGWKIAAFRKVRVQRANGTVYYETPVQADGTGWLDLFGVHPEKCWKFAAELKIGSRPRTPEQVLWSQWMESCGVPTFLWTEKDFDEIERVLKNGPDSA